MKNTITCTVKEAMKFMEHLRDDDMVTLTIVNKKQCIHIGEPQRIKKTNSEDLIKKADNIEYQDNDFFGRISLYGVVRDKNIIQSILFPQLE